MIFILDGTLHVVRHIFERVIYYGAVTYKILDIPSLCPSNVHIALFVEIPCNVIITKPRNSSQAPSN